MSVSGEEVDLLRLEWVKCSSTSSWSNSKLIQAYELILETTGESYLPERLRILPLDETFGTWILQDLDSNIFGLLWAMRLSNERCRVLAFSISTKLQGKGYGAKGWDLFQETAKKSGCEEIQLEVRQDNSSAIAMYRRRGLRKIGRITGYYQGNDGWLMLGNIR